MRIPTRTAAITVLLGIACPGALAQIATDGTMGARTTLPGPSFSILDTLGTRRGGNLFHSFSTFNLQTGETAIFSGSSPGIQNIIARVTGGARSDINGRVRSTISGSNLYLLNPYGIFFGPNATLDVTGSFYATTASYIRLFDGTKFDVSLAPGVGVSVAAPEAFGFYGSTAGITISGSTLTVPAGRQIVLAGGDLSIGPGTRAANLQAQGGRINLASIASAGELRFLEPAFDVSQFSQLGNIDIRGGALVSVNESSQRVGGGTILIRANNFTLDHSSLEARNRFVNGSGIDIYAPGRIEITGGNVIAVTTGAANAGTINLTGGEIAIKDTALVDTSCDPGCTTGNGGPLNIFARNLSIEGTSPSVSTFVVSNSFGGGNTGVIRIEADSLHMSGNAAVQAIGLAAGNSTGVSLNTGNISMTGGAQIEASTRATGAGGNIAISNTGAIHIDGTRIEPARPGTIIPSGIVTNTSGSGAAGSVVISTRTLEVLGGGEISSSSRAGATAPGGNITINAQDRILVAGADAHSKSSGIVANTFSAADAGEVNLTADAIAIRDGGRVQVQSEGTGNANMVRIRARNLTLTGQGQISSETRISGHGGTVDVDISGALVIDGHDSGIFSQAYGAGDGGAIKINAGTISLDNDGIITADARGQTGRGGTISIIGDSLVKIANGSSIGSKSFQSGLAGNVDLATTDLQITNGSITTTTNRDADAGTIFIRASNSVAMDGGIVESRSFGKGFAGNINVAAKDINITGGKITTSASFSDGGNISIKAGNQVFINGGSIETAVGGGFGNGGNIRMEQPVLVMRSGVISANAYGGAGGNIRISANAVVKSSDSTITASSQLGVDGTVVVDSPIIDPSGELVVPAANYLVADAILASRCGPRLAGKASSLIVGEIGIPANTATQLQLPLESASGHDAQSARIAWEAALAITRLASSAADECATPARPLQLGMRG